MGDTRIVGGGALGLMRVSPNAHPDPARRLLASQRDHAERLLNMVRAVVLFLLAGAALAYGPRLPEALRAVNVALLFPLLAWTGAQYALYYRRPMLPSWLPLANPILDLTGVSVAILGYGMVQSPALGLKSPMFLAYFLILAARPIASSTRRAVIAAVIAPVQYAAVLAALAAWRRVTYASTPITASVGLGVSPLDEGAKLLFLLVAGGIAIYATAWHERMAVSYYQQAHDREQIEVRLAQSQLESLKGQLQPHFLFNTLNTIMALIRAEPATAERMVSGLSALLRASLEAAGDHLVPLERELEILRAYLEIQQVRFRDRLGVTLSIDAEARGALVPYLILQPLVENAIRHGITPRATAGHVAITAACRDGRLLLEVRDDGVGARPSVGPRREGVGLGNTRARLQYLYGSAHTFTASDGVGGGFVVRAEIPLQPALQPTLQPALQPEDVPLETSA